MEAKGFPQAIALLSSEAVERQLQGLHLAFSLLCKKEDDANEGEWVEPLRPEQDESAKTNATRRKNERRRRTGTERRQPPLRFLNTLLETTVSSEKPLLRELSFLLIKEVYSGSRVVLWNETRAAVITEMSTAESAGCISAVIGVLSSLPVDSLMVFLSAKDSMSVIKSCCLSPDVNIRAVAVENIAPILLRVWCAIDRSSCPYEGKMQFESMLEARRHQEDTAEFIVDLYKNFATGIVGEAAGVELGQDLVDNSRASESCLVAVALLLEAYNSGISVVQRMERFYSALLGQLPNPTSNPAEPGVEYRQNHVSSANFESRRKELATLSSVSLSSLLQHVLPLLLKDPYYIFRRVMGSPMQSPTIIALNQLMITLLDSLPEAGALSVSSHRLTFAAVNTFTFDEVPNEEETLKSRSAQLSLNVVQLSEEWLRSHALGLITQASYNPVACEAIHLTIVMLQYSSLSHLREEVYPVLSETIFRFLKIAASSPLSQDNNCVQHARLIVWSLVLAPCLSDDLLEIYMPQVLEHIECFISDDVSRSKLIAECAFLMVVDSSGGSSGEKLVRSPQLLHQVLTHPVVAEKLRYDGSTQGKKEAEAPMRERLVASLCRLIDKLLPLAIARFVSANRISPLRSETIEEISALARGASKSGSVASENECSTSSVFGNETVDLFSSDTIAATPLEPEQQSDVCNRLLAGLGYHLESLGASLRTLQPPAERDPPAAETALEECHRVVAMGLMVSRSVQHCLMWQPRGLADMSAQLCYMSMLQALAEVLTPIECGDLQNVQSLDALLRSEGKLSSVVRKHNVTQSLLTTSMLWARPAFTDLVHCILALLSAPFEKRDYDSSAVTAKHGVLLPFVTFLAQYMKAMFGRTNAKPKQKKLLVLIENILLRRSLCPSTKPLSVESTPHSGAMGLEALGGAEGDMIADISALAPLQTKALECLEVVAYHNVDMCQEVLSLLRKFEGFIVQEAKHKHHRVNPQIDQKLRLCYRRVQLHTPPLTPQNEMPPIPPLNQSSSLGTPDDTYRSFDVSFKTCLLANYQRTSYFGADAGSKGEEWVEWLQRGVSPSRSGQGGALDDIFRLVPPVLSCEATASLAGDLFSLNSLPDTCSAFCRERSCCVAAADVLGLVDDVLDAHLCPPPSCHSALSSSSASVMQRLAREVTALRDDLDWRCISGSSDILTVLAAVSVDLSEQRVLVSVRAINSAMFKIPSFSLMVHLRPPASVSTVPVDSHASSFHRISSPVLQEGVEYFMPGAIVDRTFAFKMHAMASAEAVIRVVYPDLVVDLKSIDFFESAEQSEAEGEESARKSKHKSSDVSTVAHVDCEPLPISAGCFLVPYGLGTLSSLTEYFWQDNKVDGGIPLYVYQAVKSRLSYRKQKVVRASIAAACEDHSVSLSEQVLRDVHAASQSPHSRQSDVLSLSAMVRVDKLSSRSMRQSHCVLAWCLQTWWGEEVVVTMQLRSSRSQELAVFWWGEVELLAAEESTIVALRADLSALVSCLSAGRVVTSRGGAPVRSEDAAAEWHAGRDDCDLSQLFHKLHSGLYDPLPAEAVSFL